MGMDAKYFKENLGACLAEGLTEVANHRPVDPIRFLASWIYNYNENRKREEKRKEVKDHLELQYEERLAELGSAEKVKAEELLTAPTFEEQPKDPFQEQREDTPEKLTEIDGTSHQPLRQEVAEKKAEEMTTEEKVGHIPEEYETRSTQEVLENRVDQDDLNVVINELDEQPGQVSPSLTLQEASLEIAADEDLSPNVLDDNDEDQLEQGRAAEKENDDVQTEGDEGKDQLEQGRAAEKENDVQSEGDKGKDQLEQGRAAEKENDVQSEGDKGKDQLEQGRAAEKENDVQSEGDKGKDQLEQGRAAEKENDVQSEGDKGKDQLEQGRAAEKENDVQSEGDKGKDQLEQGRAAEKENDVQSEGDKGKDQLEQDRAVEKENDVQAEGDTQAEIDRSIQDGNSE